MNESPIPEWNSESRLVRAFSFGGGVQSHAVLVLQAQGKLPQPYDVFLFSNVGHDSENPDTLAYLDTYTRPFCEEHGIPLVELRRKIRGRGEVTLLEEIYYQQKSIIIPAYFGQGGIGNRNCTTDFKVRVFDRYIRDANYTHGIVGLGISMDELTRARSLNWHHFEGQDYEEAASDGEHPQTALFGGDAGGQPESSAKPSSPRNIGYWKRREYPLLELYMTREGCKQVIESVGLPEPPKSSCWWCPFKRPAEWVELKEKRPDLFEKAVNIENAINEKHLHLAKDGMFLHRAKRPLIEAVTAPEAGLFGDNDDSCDSGHCFV